MSEGNRSFPAVQARTRRLPFGFQVLAGIGLLFALLAASIMVAVLSIISLSEDQAELQDKNVPYAVGIATAALNAKGMANDERGYLISGNREFLEEFEQRLLNVRNAFAAAVIAAGDERQRDAVRDAHAGFEQWVWAVRSQFKTFQAGDREAATDAALGRGRTLRKAYEDQLVEAEAVASTAIQLQRNSFTSSGWVIVLLVFLLVVLSVCVGLTVWLARTLNAASGGDELSEPLPAPIPLPASPVGARQRRNS